MAIEYSPQLARLVEFVSVEEADGLLDWLQKNPQGELDLSQCAHLHAANLQVLMAAKHAVAAWPQDAALADWLRSALMINR